MYSNGFSKKWFWKFFMMWFFWKKFSNREFSKIPNQKYFLKSLKVLFLCVFYGNISQTLGTFFLPFHQLKIGVTGWLKKICTLLYQWIVKKCTNFLEPPGNLWTRDNYFSSEMIFPLSFEPFTYFIWAVLTTMSIG